MPTVAFATHQQSPRITDDDQLVAKLLRDRGIDVRASVWDSPGISWCEFDCVVIRSTWDYHTKPARFAAWLQSFSAAGTCLWNPPAAVLNNMNKRYLLDLAARGIDVVPTMFHPKGATVTLDQVFAESRWNDVVVKPAVSASAWETWRTSAGKANEHGERFSRQVQTHDVLVQPFIPEIAARGEWSLVFIGGAYSHAVLKRPGSGDFRVQQHLGGTAIRAEPRTGIIASAERILATLGEPLLYARVDGFERDGRFVLMELEVIEPFLFLGYSDVAAHLLADAIVARL